MGIRKILTDKDPALHKTCKPVTDFNERLWKLLDDMKETLKESGGVGLAAPQVGILRRVVVVDTGEEIVELVNPSLLETSGEQYGPEGCLSIPEFNGYVVRPQRVTVKGSPTAARTAIATGMRRTGAPDAYVSFARSISLAS